MAEQKTPKANDTPEANKKPEPEINPEANNPESDSLDPNDSDAELDQLRGRTTLHANPPRLEDEGQSGG